MFSKPQRRSCQHRQSRRNSRRRSIPQRPRQRQKIHRVSARTIYAPGQKQSSRRAYQRQRHRSRPVAPMSSGQRNPAQKKRLRWIIFIRSRRKFGLRTICRRAQRRRSAKGQRLQSCAVNRFSNRHQKMRRTFSISSRLVHGRRAALNFIAAAKHSLFVSDQQSHRRAIYHPRRKRRLGKPLWKSKRSSCKVHPLNPSIHPNRLTQFCRSRLFRKHPQLRQSVSRSRLAEANRPYLSSHQHQRTPHQWSSCPPSARSRSQTPHRGNAPSIVFLFVQGIRNKSARQR